MASPQAHVRNLVLRLASKFAPAGDDPVPDLGSLRRVLLVYVNWRLGNNVLVTPAVEGLTRQFPETTFDFLGGPAAAAVLPGFRLGRVLTIRPLQLYDPVRLALFRRRLRRAGYEAAVHVHSSTGTMGAFLTRLSGAPVRIGCRRPQGNVYFTSTIDPPVGAHKVDRCNELIAALGVERRQDRMLHLDPGERRAGAQHLDALAPPADGPRVVLFAGGRGRKGKVLPLAFYAGLSRRLREAGRQPVLLFGPEEARRMRAAHDLLPDVPHVSRMPIRTVAAVMAAAQAVVTPDSGPMHLAIAAGTPTVAVLRRADSGVWGPLPHEGCVVVDPPGTDVGAVCAALDDLL